LAELVVPHVRYIASFLEALSEGHHRDTLRPETPETIAEVAADPGAYVASLLSPPGELILPDGTVGQAIPSTMLWRVEGETYLGWINIRHGLNANLEKVGGHIGYAVRPSARGQGHAAAMLAGALDWVRANLPLDRVLLTVNPSNPHSIRVIEKNGGVHTDTIDHLWLPGQKALHYWITL
jgi:predicted acetyltransferase